MKRAIIAIILAALGLLLVPVPSVASAAGIEVVDRTGDGWTDDTWQVEIYPGEEKATTLSLYNSSSSSLDVEVTVSPDSLDNGNLTFKVDKASFTMPGRSNADVILTVNANGSATPGVYTTELEIKSEVPPSRPPGGGGGFGITRYLRVDLWGEEFKTRVTSVGEVRADLEAVSIDEMVTLYIAKGVLAQTEDEQRLRKIEVLPIISASYLSPQSAEPPPLPENGYIVGFAYDFAPAGATFAPPIELEISYAPPQEISYAPPQNPPPLPDDLDEEDLLIAYYDEEAGEWLELDGVVDTVGDTITAEVSHFTAFAIICYRVPPVPAAFTVSKLIISPAEVDIGQSVTISAIIINTGGETGTYEAALKIDGVVEATKEVTVSAGVSITVTFTTAKDVAGSYSVDVNGLSGSFTVKEKPAPVPTPTPTPMPIPEKPLNWLLIGGIIAGMVAIGLGVFFWVRRSSNAGKG